MLMLAQEIRQPAADRFPPGQGSIAGGPTEAVPPQVRGAEKQLA